MASLKTLFQMENLEETDPKSNNTLALMAEAQRRGLEIYQFTPQDLGLSYDGNLNGNVAITANARRVRLHLDDIGYNCDDVYEDVCDDANHANRANLTARGHSALRHFEYLSRKQQIDLQAADVHSIHIRQDPPFDMQYITATYILEQIKDDVKSKVKLVNSPFWVRNLPEKIFSFAFAKYMPKTLISSCAMQIQDFVRQQWQAGRQVIIKPLYSFHGYGVFKFNKNDPNLEALLEMELSKPQAVPIIAQEYIPEISQGNKRIIFINGEIAGSLITTPHEGEHRIYRKSEDKPYQLNDSDKEICHIIAKECKAKDLYFVGIDIIGKYLTEVNVTSVGSILRLNKIYNTRVEKLYWDGLML